MRERSVEDRLLPDQGIMRLTATGVERMVDSPKSLDWVVCQRGAGVGVSSECSGLDICGNRQRMLEILDQLCIELVTEVVVIIRPLFREFYDVHIVECSPDPRRLHSLTPDDSRADLGCTIAEEHQTIPKPVGALDKGEPLSAFDQVQVEPETGLQDRHVGKPFEEADRG